MATKKQKTDELWRRGILHWKCHSVQKEMYDIFTAAEDYSTHFWLLARQSGKSYLMAMLALEQALSKENSIVKLMTDTKTHLESIYEPLMREILVDCPKDIKPEYTKKTYTYHFKNGSQIQLAGSDNKHYEKLRGQKAELVLIDEAGFCNDLRQSVISVLRPTTTHTGGKIVLASTPAIEPDHESWLFVEKSEMNKTLVKKTIFDNPLLNQEQIDVIIDECGGQESIDFRREYMCERIRDDDVIVFPEFTDELEAEIVKEHLPRPAHFSTYESMDLGHKDLSVILFAYYDFNQDKLVIEDELTFTGKEFIYPSVIEQTLAKEETLWTNVYTNEVNRPKIRVSDINPLVTQELSRASNGRMTFTAARKDDASAAINTLRTMLAGGKIIIHPRCETLVRHIKNCQWNKRKARLEFARSAENGHYDAVDALKYLIRHIDYNNNPYPYNYNLDTKNTYFTQGEKSFARNNSQARNLCMRLFNRKPNGKQ